MFRYLENPIDIKGHVYEKKELDEWIYNFRKKEQDFQIGLMCRSEAEIDCLFENFTKAAEMHFENTFSSKISVFKRVIFEGCYFTSPAIISFRGEE